MAAFAATLRGQLIRPEDAEYDEARHVWNGSIDRRPGFIVRCAGTADVIASVSFARTHGLRVAVRGGGHSFAGHSVCDGGMVIDLSRMKSVRIDPAAAHCASRAGRALERPGSRGAGVRSRDDWRRRLAHRHRGPGRSAAGKAG